MAISELNKYNNNKILHKPNFNLLLNLILFSGSTVCLVNKVNKHDVQWKT